MNPRVIAVVGGKKSGKTTTIELLIKELAGRGYIIAAVKHIPEPNFTIDEEGKDTWKYAQAGATTIIAVSSQEIATIEKVAPANLSLKKVLQKCRDCDLVFLEGFRDLVVKDTQDRQDTRGQLRRRSCQRYDDISPDNSNDWTSSAQDRTATNSIRRRDEESEKVGGPDRENSPQEKRRNEFSDAS